MKYPAMGEDVLFRSARRSDLAAIIALLANDELGAAREGAGAEAMSAYEKAFRAITTDPNNELIVAELDGEIAGCLQLTILPGLTYTGGTRAQIEGVRVAAGMRGKSIGRRMFAYAIEQARARGAMMMQLTTNSSRPDAHRFYEELGFEASHTGFKLVL